MRYFEDFKVGETIELGSRTINEEEIITFAQQFDPQPFHLDKEKARVSIFGTLVASGWHTGSIFMRLMVDSLLKDSAAQASPGIDQLRWVRPVKPGDTLSVRLKVLRTRLSGSRPNTGIVYSLCEMVNQHGELVMRMEFPTFYGLRPEEEAGAILTGA